MRLVRACVILLALGPGLFMTFDGLRALIVGDYLTPKTGRYAGQLGPWSDIVSAVGIQPRSTIMKAVFVGFGMAWLGAAVAFAKRTPRSTLALAFVSVATSWYLPIGTLIAALVLGGLVVQRGLRHGETLTT